VVLPPSSLLHPRFLRGGVRLEFFFRFLSKLTISEVKDGATAPFRSPRSLIRFFQFFTDENS